MNVLKTLILLLILSACAKKNCNIEVDYSFPRFPQAGVQVAEELEKVCDDKKCSSLNRYLSELYLFKLEYETVMQGKV